MARSGATYATVCRGRAKRDDTIRQLETAQHGRIASFDVRGQIIGKGALAQMGLVSGALVAAGGFEPPTKGL